MCWITNGNCKIDMLVTRVQVVDLFTVLKSVDDPFFQELASNFQAQIEAELDTPSGLDTGISIVSSAAMAERLNLIKAFKAREVDSVEAAGMIPE